jgi:hypothetical protein
MQDICCMLCNMDIISYASFLTNFCDRGWDTYILPDERLSAIWQLLGVGRLTGPESGV